MHRRGARLLRSMPSPGGSIGRCSSMGRRTSSKSSAARTHRFATSHRTPTESPASPSRPRSRSRWCCRRFRNHSEDSRSRRASSRESRQRGAKDQHRRRRLRRARAAAREAAPHDRITTTRTRALRRVRRRRAHRKVRRAGREVPELPRQRAAARGHRLSRRHREDEAVPPPADQPRAGRREADVAELAGRSSARDRDPATRASPPRPRRGSRVRSSSTRASTGSRRRRSSRSCESKYDQPRRRAERWSALLLHGSRAWARTARSAQRPVNVRQARGPSFLRPSPRPRAARRFRPDPPPSLLPQVSRP